MHLAPFEITHYSLAHFVVRHSRLAISPVGSLSCSSCLCVRLFDSGAPPFEGVDGPFCVGAAQFRSLKAPSALVRAILIARWIVARRVQLLRRPAEDDLVDAGSSNSRGLKFQHC